MHVSDVGGVSAGGLFIILLALLGRQFGGINQFHAFRRSLVLCECPIQNNCS